MSFYQTYMYVMYMLDYSDMNGLLTQERGNINIIEENTQARIYDTEAQCF